MALPRMLRVRQKFEAPTVEDIPAAVRAEVQRLDLFHQCRFHRLIEAEQQHCFITGLPAAKVEGADIDAAIAQQ